MKAPVLVCPACGAIPEPGSIYQVCPKCAAWFDVPRTHPDDPGEPQHGLRRVGIDPGEASLLALFARGARILEIGTGLGYSTRALIQGGAREIDTLDVDPWVRSKIVPGLIGEWERACGSVDGFRALSDPADIGVNYDLAFVDGAHDYESVRVDAVRAIRAVRHGGLIFFHDWSGIDPVERAVRSIFATPESPLLFSLATRYGIGVLAVDTEAKRRAIECGVTA